MNNIGTEGAKIISEVLKSNSTLTELNLRCDEKETEETICYWKINEKIIQCKPWTGNNISDETKKELGIL